MRREYHTQMEAARLGILTPELETVARKEGWRTEDLMPLVAAGKVAIPANRLHTPHQDQRQSGGLPGLQGL